MNNPEKKNPIDEANSIDDLKMIRVENLEGSKMFSDYREALKKVQDTSKVDISRIVLDYKISDDELLDIHPKLDQIVQNLKIVSPNGLGDYIDVQKAIAVIVIDSDLSDNEKEMIFSKLPYFSDPKTKHEIDESFEVVDVPLRNKSEDRIEEGEEVLVKGDEILETEEKLQKEEEYLAKDRLIELENESEETEKSSKFGYKTKYEKIKNDEVITQSDGSSKSIKTKTDKINAGVTDGNNILTGSAENTVIQKGDTLVKEPKTFEGEKSLTKNDKLNTHTTNTVTKISKYKLNLANKAGSAIKFDD